MTTNPKSPLILMLLGLFGVIVAVISRQALIPLPPVDPPPAVKLPPAPGVVAGPHLKWADQECERIIDEHVKTVDLFFADAKRNTRVFSEEALSWGSKWRLVVDYVPFTKGGRHETFIRERFEERVFKPSQLADAVEQVVASYLKHVTSIEGNMLVRIRADVVDFPSTYRIAELDESALTGAYNHAISQAVANTGSKLRADIAADLVSLITGELLTQVAVRIGVSAGVLGTGATAGAATFGIGLVVGVIVDQIISWVWDWYADPRGNLANDLNGKLDEINRLIVDGSAEVQGLRERLHRLAKDRSELRSNAVFSLLESQNKGAK